MHAYEMTSSDPSGNKVVAAGASIFAVAISVSALIISGVGMCAKCMPTPSGRNFIMFIFDGLFSQPTKRIQSLRDDGVLGQILGYMSLIEQVLSWTCNISFC